MEPDYKLACEMHLQTIETQARIIANALPRTLAPHIKDALVETGGCFMPETVWAAIIEKHDQVVSSTGDRIVWQGNYSHILGSGIPAYREAIPERSETPSDSRTAQKAGGLWRDPYFRQLLGHAIAASTLESADDAGEKLAAYADANANRHPAADAGGLSESMVQYEHGKGGATFKQFAKDPLPKWATNVRPYVEESPAAAGGLSGCERTVCGSGFTPPRKHYGPLEYRAATEDFMARPTAVMAGDLSGEYAAHYYDPLHFVKHLHANIGWSGAVGRFVGVDEQLAKRFMDVMAHGDRARPAASGCAARLIPDSECVQSKCACTTTGCWGECSMKRNPVVIVKGGAA